jgi:FkbM family methyltransferase
MENNNFVCYGKTEKVSITMDDFYLQINKFIDSKEIKTIIDAGTMDGGDAIYFKNKYPYSNVYAIEGLPDNYNKYLINNKNIIGINAVIANYDGNIKYYQKNINGIHGIFNRGSEYGTLTLDLPCYKLSTIIKKYNINTIDILKIDVEGATLELLQSLENNLNDVKIMHIETETYPFFEGQKLHDEVCIFLQNNNFVLIDITFVEILPGKFQSDSIWINNKFYK